MKLLIQNTIAVQRSKIIYIGIAVLFIAHLLSYIYFVPEDVEEVFKFKGFVPKNPHLSWQRLTLYGIIWLYSYKDARCLLNMFVCSVVSGFIWNELFKENQDWTIGIWIGFVLTILFPIYEYKKHDISRK